MNQKMSDEAVNLALGSVVLGLSRGARQETVDRAYAELKDLGPEIARARSEEARLLEERVELDAKVQALADALERTIEVALPGSIEAQIRAALRLVGR